MTIYRNLDPNRYAPPRNYKRRPKHPEPSENWQTREYIRVMNKLPPENKDDWQWRYNPRTKESRERMKEFLDDNMGS